ncbi:hypothetical protein CYFUS_004683 [Cystobacter fuscus]|uniref:Glycosyltransferase RgtA/B/C/D-like domain-containing protein n=1 Tax=Cystobacter fuscus TaxID=43 RepID=A0A250J5N2_9BACT|nr:hypothetical protein [Cystobacter fuscus]ATB39239.1 hypothetical protein CYFUS_004683 [Cystobacter fuscus]
MLSAPPCGSASARRWHLPLLFALWGLFASWCVAGSPPCVDLAAHGAQLETLRLALRGDPAVRAVYGVHFPWGYGLIYWLLLPLAIVTNGAVAVRVGLWLALMLYPVSHLALVRAWRRSDAVLLVGLPLAFNLSYWYGLLSGLFAQSLAFLTLAAFVRALEAPSPRRFIWVNLLAAATFLSHLVAFAAISVAMAAVALSGRPWRARIQGLAVSMGLPVLLSLPKAWSMATRAVTPGDWPVTEYNAASHINWFFKTYQPEGWLAAVGPLLVTLAFGVYWLRRRREEPAAPAMAFLALVALYLVTPKTLSGIFLVSVRLPVLAGMCSLLMVDWRVLPRALRAGLVLLSLFSLGETAVFHERFARAVEGLDEVMAGGPPGRNGYLSLVGATVLGSRHIYLAHLGQWLTATRGGVGHDFFTDARHHPVHALPGQAPVSDVRAATLEQRQWFDTVLVFGEGTPPEPFDTWRETAHAGRWRRLERP